MHDRLNTLANRSLDRELSPAEERELEELVRNNPQAAREVAELQELDRLLSQVDEVEAPAGLKTAVMNALPAVRRPAATRVPQRTSFLELLAGFFQPQQRLSLAVAFSVGLAVGISLLAVVSGSDLGEPVELVGTMGAATTVEHLDGADVSGTATIGESEQRVAVRLTVDAAGPVEAELTFDAETLRPRAFINETEGVAIGANIGPGVISWIAPPDAQVLVEFSRTAGTTGELNWTLLRDGEVIASRKLAVR